MCHSFIIGLVVIFASFVLTESARAEKRVALVIGNEAYEHAPKLATPTRDAAAIAEMFRKAGFEMVITHNNVGNLEFKRALRNFLLAAQSSDIAVLFYSGHGIQIGEQNYMVPVDAKLAREYDAKDEAISLDRIVEALEPAKRLRLVILDACRDNPFLVTMKQRVMTRGITRGLAPVGPTGVDTLIAYAAKAGSTAREGTDGHSPYTKALLKHIAEPGLDVRLAFGRIRDDVLKQTGQEQEPFVYGSLGGSVISLVPAPVIAKQTPIADISADYNLVEKINTKTAWEVFINTHRTGILVDVARKRMELLEEQERKLASLQHSNEPAKPSAAEIKAWNKVKDSGDRNAIDNFLKSYEASPLAGKAREILKELDRINLENEQKAVAEREAADKKAKEVVERLRAEAEAERMRAEREAELRQKASDEADRRRIEQEIALKRTADAEDDRKRKAEACRLEEQRLNDLKAALEEGDSHDDLLSLEQWLLCDQLRPAVVALLNEARQLNQLKSQYDMARAINIKAAWEHFIRIAPPGPILDRARRQLQLLASAQPLVRFALVIANSAYEHTPVLVNPRADATAVTEVLKTLNFSVTLKYNLGREALRSALREFEGQVRNHTPDWALVYFSGHGAETQEGAFMLPTDILLPKGGEY